jgi:hypothetical protein
MQSATDKDTHLKKKEKSGITNWMSGAYKSQGKAMSSDAEQQSSRAAEQQSSRAADSRVEQQTAAEQQKAEQQN